MIGDVRQWCFFPVIRSSNSATHTDVADERVHLAEGADYMTPASDCHSPSKLEREYPPETSKPFIGFRVVCESSGPN